MANNGSGGSPSPASSSLSSSSPASSPDWGWAEEIPDISGKVAICGIGEVIHRKASGQTAREIALEAIEKAIADAGLAPEDIDGLCYGPFAGEPVDAAAFRRHFGVGQEIWESTKGGGMVWSATAPLEAARAIEEGKAKYIINSFAVAWATERSRMVGGPGESHAQEGFKQNMEVPFGWFPQPVYFATIARRHMLDFGTTEEQLGGIAVAQRAHANLNPDAVMHEKPLSLEDYRDSPYIADPFRKEDCCLISDGGGAYIMTTPERAKDCPEPPAFVAGLGLGTSASAQHWAQQSEFTSTPQVFAAPKALEFAGIKAADLDVLCVYDPFTIVALMQLEDIGLCAKGEGGDFVQSQGIIHDKGAIAFNTHGGLLSHSYVLGIAHVMEIVKQIRGTSPAQAKDVDYAAYGGFTGPQAGLLILGKDEPG